MWVVRRTLKPTSKDHWSVSALNQVVYIDILTHRLFDTPVMRVRIVAESACYIFNVRASVRQAACIGEGHWTDLHPFIPPVPSRSRRPSSVPIRSIL